MCRSFISILIIFSFASFAQTNDEWIKSDLPKYLSELDKEIAKTEGVSINQLISSAITEKISAIMTEDYLKKRAERANIKDVLIKKKRTILIVLFFL